MMKLRCWFLWSVGLPRKHQIFLTPPKTFQQFLCFLNAGEKVDGWFATLRISGYTSHVEIYRSLEGLGFGGAGPFEGEFSSGELR